MTTQTMFDTAPANASLADRLKDTPLDPAKGRAREYRVIFALSFAVLVPVMALARLAPNRRKTTLVKRSVIAEAKSAAGSALAYAYRH